MTPLQKAVQAVIEDHCDKSPYFDDAMAELRKALAADLAQAVEPVAWIERDMQCDDFDPDSVTCSTPVGTAEGWEWVPLYLQPAPPAKSFAEVHPANPNATCKCEHWQSCAECHPTAHPAQAVEPVTGERAKLIHWLRERSMWDGMLRLIDAANMLEADATLADDLTIAYMAGVEAGRKQAQQVAVPMTHGEIYTAYITAANQTLRPQDERIALAFARAIEAHHGITARLSHTDWSAA